jgi:hypothetical protein
MVRIDYETREIIYKRKRYPLRPYKLYLLKHFEKLCFKHRVKSWIFDWETIFFHSRKWFIIYFYLNELKYETEKETKKNKNSRR